ncbi:hypothetical protein R3W88_028410 [Solanum pinnatisectum]|uniref:Uncharacterized protein n=1 Tax=Solanum pinnatisectum TaxID=50273 RepID=A0AAV9LIU6_9SOLN|nr:hypothetical protein R3W88_028410 [Solanum pinnatisectum]
MIVEEINILTTVLLRYDCPKIIYSNSVLSIKPISNYYHSTNMRDAIEFGMHISTPMEKIAFDERENNKIYTTIHLPLINFSCIFRTKVMRDIEDLNMIRWSVWITHTMKLQDMGVKWARTALLLDIEYRMLPLDVNVRNMPRLLLSESF